MIEYFFVMALIGLFFYLLFAFGQLVDLEFGSRDSERLDRFQYQGMIGEQMVEERLKQLSPEFEVIPNVMINAYRNIDFVVVGPTGVWNIEVKSHKGRVEYKNGRLLRNGQLFEKHFIDQVWSQVHALKYYIGRFDVKNYIHPVICFSSPAARVRFGYKKQAGVYVIGLPWLLDLVQNNKRLYTSEQVQLIANVLRSAEPNFKFVLLRAKMTVSD